MVSYRLTQRVVFVAGFLTIVGLVFLFSVCWKASKCNDEESKLCEKQTAVPGLPWVFAITPTYARPTQAADMTRLAQTLMHVRNLHWVVVEDAAALNGGLARMLLNTGISFSYVYKKTSDELVNDPMERNPLLKRPRGVEQRNFALAMIDFWLKSGKMVEDSELRSDPRYDTYFGPNCLTKSKVFSETRTDEFVIYFMDDDNTYSLFLFETMRHVSTVGFWHVGLSGEVLHEGPICKAGTNRIVGFRGTWGRRRKFPVDMAGFAVNLHRFLRKPVLLDPYSSVGSVETNFLEALNVTLEESEARPPDCNKVLAWHTRTQKPVLVGEKHLPDHNIIDEWT